MSNRVKTLVAGIGNIFLGDDAFGVEVIRRLLAQPLPEGVTAIDFGIRGFDLAQAILSEYQKIILVDAVCRGGAPGTLYLIQPEVEATGTSDLATLFMAHSLDPARVLQYVQAVGGRLPPVWLVGCEPASFGTEDEPQMGLSSPVANAIDHAVTFIHELVKTCTS